MSNRRSNHLEPLNAATVTQLVQEPLPTFEEAEKLFYANEKAKNRSKRTIAWHRENMHAFKKALGEQQIPLDLVAITYRTIRNHLVLYAIEQWNNKPRTINMRLQTLRQFFDFLVDEGYLSENPATRVKKLKDPDSLIVALSPDQVRRMLAVPDKQTFTGFRDYTIMLLLLDTGLRLSEVSGLLIGEGHINFSEGWIKVLGKGARERTVPLQGKLKRTLKTYLAHRGQDLDHDYCFVTIDNDPLRNRSIQDRLEWITRKAGITDIQTSPHIWRHTFARLYILNGGDPFSLRKILGHKSWQMVHRYVNLFGSQIQDQHKKASPLENLERF